MKRWIPFATVITAAALLVFFLWAPVVPFERLANVEAPRSAVLCPGSQICEVRSYTVWVRSYGSFAYEAFGLGTTPFAGPVSVEKNGVVTVMVFSGTNQTSSLGFPSSSPEPVPLLRINGVTFYPQGGPFGGSTVQVSVTNMGVGETASVTWWIGTLASYNFQSNPIEIPAGGTARMNATSWTGPLPPQNSNVTITLQATLYYPKLWLHASDTQTVRVVYSP